MLLMDFMVFPFFRYIHFTFPSTYLKAFYRMPGIHRQAWTQPSLPFPWFDFNFSCPIRRHKFETASEMLLCKSQSDKMAVY